MLSRGPEMVLKVYPTMCSDVGILKVFPGITPAAVSNTYHYDIDTAYTFSTKLLFRLSSSPTLCAVFSLERFSRLP